MFKIYDTIEEFNSKNEELNISLGYPNEFITTYSEPIITIDNKYAMQVLDTVKNSFADSELVGNIEVKEE